MIGKIRFAALAMTAALTLPFLQAATATAGEYPEKPVSMIVAYSPGGGTDTAARVIAKYVQPHLGQRLIIQNKPGAGGQIGFTELARSQPDGYKIGFINIPSIFMVKMLRENVPYEMSDFEAIANIQLDPVMLVVKADSPLKTFQDFLDAAKKAPGEVNVGGDGPQSNNQLQVVVAEDKLGVDVNFVSFDGSGPAITATLGDQVVAAVPSASSATTHILNGRLRALAVFSEKRYKYLPDVPTIKEASGVDVPGIGASMRGIAVPKGVSPEQKKVLEAAFAKVMEDPEFLAHAEKMGLPLDYMNGADFDAYIQSAAEAVEAYIPLLK
ncbi:Bug family tripartite tricarboxylate transporter substrate binding protein [Sneathiella chinensis]|uniref:Recombinase RecA n=1 Tax=Sneathiella chinensis TaxID=349750 RepID=A0ABQ5U137_9PROT|nr:tripartite tricarboxylate transporter substrate binding protein [Sneathiella chinensis]GLQ05880.1 recombinase RecA [Sneathiella chinensis]